MALTAKVLATTTCPTTAGGGSIYAVPASTKAYVKFFRIFNTNATTQTVIIFVNADGTNREIGRFVLAQNEWAEVIEKDAALTLEAADSIQGQTTTAGAVECVITGAEET